MSTNLTSKGQVTIPKHIRDALQLSPGMAIEFSVSASGDVVLHAPRLPRGRTGLPKNRFEAARGKADIKWRTDDLMKLLRADD